MVSGCCIEFKEKVEKKIQTQIKRKTNSKPKPTSSSIYGPVEIDQFQAKEVFKKPSKKPPLKNCGYQNAVVLASVPVRDVDCSLSFGKYFFLYFLIDESKANLFNFFIVTNESRLPIFESTRSI
jgi:hypothetical protein